VNSRLISNGVFSFPALFFFPLLSLFTLCPSRHGGSIICPILPSLSERYLFSVFCCFNLSLRVRLPVLRLFIFDLPSPQAPRYDNSSSFSAWRDTNYEGLPPLFSLINPIFSIPLDPPNVEASRTGIPAPFCPYTPRILSVEHTLFFFFRPFC